MKVIKSDGRRNYFKQGLPLSLSLILVSKTSGCVVVPQTILELDLVQLMTHIPVLKAMRIGVHSFTVVKDVKARFICVTRPKSR